LDLDIFYRLRWIDTGGGPHLLLAEESLSSWGGIGDREDEDEDPDDSPDPSDYTRACRLTDRMVGVIPCGDGDALVLAGVPNGNIAWIPTLGRSGGFLAQPLHVVDETDLRSTLLSSLVAEALNGPGAEKACFSTGSSGVMRLFDSALAGHFLGAPRAQIKVRDLAPHLPPGALPSRNAIVPDGVLALEPGRYQMRAAFVKTDNLEIVVREITRDADSPEFS
jgi:hypothetical protein